MTSASRPSPLTLPLASPDADLARAGGKGASLAVLIDAGLPVPGGFVVTTAAYRRFVADNALQPRIAAAVSGLDGSDAARLEAAAEAIRADFERAEVPPEIAEAVATAYAALEAEVLAEALAEAPADATDDPPIVAVRSSATAEDLPDLSFAGQQETFLGVRGQAAVLGAVRRCWASLWTPRAIAYRARHGVPDEDVAMAVVVQRLVPAESAGIVFTANPLDGRRDRMVIEAAWGLGEAVVGGHVTPDALILDKASGAVVERQTADKAVMTVRTDEGSAEQAVPDSLRAQPVLDDAAAAELAALARRIEDRFGRPMDVEWARAGGRFAILQARPITALPEPAAAPPTTWEPPIPGSAWLRRQVVEHMPDPLSPLFDELYLQDGLDHSVAQLLAFMGLRPDWVQRFFGWQGSMFHTINGFAYVRADIRLGIRSMASMARIYLTMVPRMARKAIPYWRDEQLPAYLATIERWATLDLEATGDERLIEGVRELADADAVYWFAANFPLALAKMTDGLLERFVRSIPPEAGETPRSSGPLLRGYPSKTLDAQVALEGVAARIAADPALRTRVLDHPPADLMRVLGDEPGAAPARDALAAYLERYGHQIYTLDFAVPTQGEDPLPVLVGLHALLAHPERDARAMQAAFAAERERLAAELMARLGPIRRPVFRTILRWAQRYAPDREEALYHVGAAWPTLRRLALELGRRLTEAGTLETADDVFYLRSDELRAAAVDRAKGRARPDLRERARERRALRDSRVGLVPPPTVPPGHRMMVGPIDLSSEFQPKVNAAEGDAIEGFAVSPGRVTAPASVILSPADFGRMRPDSILVCPTTTPAWTPLFAQAVGLVTDIGGVLAHGSIVAREYGIPAVMGTTVATSRIRDGQLVTVDGTEGTVSLG